jgi:hypothetical protein
VAWAKVSDSIRKTAKVERAGSMAQVFTIKPEALSSNASTAKQTKLENNFKSFLAYSYGLFSNQILLSMKKEPSYSL